jgi:hypothetical protein
MSARPSDEVLNVGASFNDRYTEKRAGPDRSLRLHLTDGVTRVGPGRCCSPLIQRISNHCETLNGIL